MKKFFTCIAACCIAYCCFAQNTGAGLDTILSTYARAHKFNGSALIVKKGEVLLNKGYGYRNVADNIPNDENTVFQLGSITKQFTTAIILKLQDEKKLNVKDKLSKYFPKYPKGDSITIEQLMLHTSGIYSYTNDNNFMQNEITKPSSREKMMALFKDKPLDFSPGTQWNYSNSAYLLLGYIIEKVTKKPYEQIVRNYIFTPLQMTHSGFDFAHLTIPEKATGYFGVKDKNATKSPVVDSSVSFSAGAIYSTVGDLHKWHEALENYTILTKEQQEKAFTPVLNHYGYGWVIDSVEGKRRVSHGGSIPGFNTNLVRIPEDDICIILLSNGFDKSLDEIKDKMLSLLYNKPVDLPKQKISIPLPDASLKQYEGEYEIRPGLRVTMSIKDGLLNAAPTNQTIKILYAEREDLFFEPEEDVVVEFFRNYKNEVDAFVILQGGKKILCRKVN